MAGDIANTFRHFLKHHVLRTDYVIVEELSVLPPSLPYAHKLDRVQGLCIRQGYRDSSECEKIRSRLYSDENIGARPASLLLIESYLPECIFRTCNPEEPVLAEFMRDLEQQTADLPGGNDHFRASRLDWEGNCYLMYLPLDIHYLLIEHDGALLAA